MEIFAEKKIREAMAEWHDLPLILLSSVDSTNVFLKERVRSGDLSAPCLVLADYQTAGRGRLGRAFVSPPGTGLYMSLLLRPEIGAEIQKMTVLAAVAVCLALEEITPLRPKIKWVNDLFVKGRKVCGILAEYVENQVIIGIGVNLQTPPGGFPPEAGIAGALDIPLSREELAGKIARNLLAGMKNLSDSELMDAYRARMPLIGREITYLQSGQEKNARVTGVANDGGLIVITDGKEEILRSGEISLGSYSFSGLE